MVEQDSQQNIVRVVHVGFGIYWMSRFSLTKYIPDDCEVNYIPGTFISPLLSWDEQINIRDNCEEWID